MYPYLKRRDLADVIKIKDAEITEIILNYLVVYVCSFSCVQFLATLWIIACQAPLPMVLSRQECWNGLPFPPLEDIRSNHSLLYWQTDSLLLSHPGVV